ncbi:hypothetical protein ACN38_g2587 [Penicillium nordicum]|uniref:Uncharacterized protein n=1 Tax=Penicillium nordicum TaxID=229535 RepID=A0A0M8PDN8_9EURO|nr:hypothetical protein ACN38_g2587 [Penicillium nordicum]
MVLTLILTESHPIYTASLLIITDHLQPLLLFHYVIHLHTYHNTYDHRVWKTGLPVRSAVLKPHAGELVVGWVTTSESSLLYVFVPYFYIYIIAK